MRTERKTFWLTVLIVVQQRQVKASTKCCHGVFKIMCPTFSMNSIALYLQKNEKIVLLGTIIF